MKVSLITTVLNEEKTIGEFLTSVSKQTRLPDEVIIVDAGSTDTTLSVISRISSRLRGAPDGAPLRSNNKQIKIMIIVKSGNRAVGRNEAIKHATGDVIACTDGDCILDKNWVKNIVKPFDDTTIDAVAGYYKGRAKTVFQKCLVPYVLVMEDKIDPQRFLPSSRSIAFRKRIWSKIGGFPQQLSYSEDYLFAKRLKKTGVKIVFASNAIAYWIPRDNLKEAIVMFFNFSSGDVEAGILRPKVVFIFFRYFLGIYLFIFASFSRSLFLITIFILSIIAYLIWSIIKNYRYVKDIRACYVLPMLQLSADAAVISGTIGGGIKRWGIQERP